MAEIYNSHPHFLREQQARKSFKRTMSAQLWRSSEMLPPNQKPVSRIFTSRHFLTPDNVDGYMQDVRNDPIRNSVIPELVDKTMIERGLGKVPHPTQIVVSPYRRTHQTVMYIAERYGWDLDEIPILCDSRIGERNQGKLGGNKSQEQADILLEQYQNDVTEYLQSYGIEVPPQQHFYDSLGTVNTKHMVHLLGDHFFHAGTDGESLMDVYQRALPAYVEYAYLPGSTFVCCHGGVMLAMGMNSKTFSTIDVHEDEIGARFFVTKEQ